MAKQRNFKVKRWFDLVRESARLDPDDPNDHPLQPLIDSVEGAAQYFVEAVEDAEEHLVPVGKLEQMLSETTGLAFFYSGFHTDALQIRKWLETLLEGTKAEKYVWYTSHPDAKAEYGKLSATEASNHVKADEDVQILSDLIRLMASRQHMLEDIREGFTTRGIMLSKIVDTRAAGNEEVWIDGTRETENH